MRRLKPYGRRSGKRTLARRIALFVVGVAAVCCARTFNRSFRNGYSDEANTPQAELDPCTSCTTSPSTFSAELAWRQFPT